MAKLSITLEDIDTIVSKLNSSSEEIEKIWNSVKSTEIQQIKESWVGKDCESYIQKIDELDADAKKALQAQRLLADTFTKAKAQITSTQETIASSISSL